MEIQIYNNLFQKFTDQNVLFYFSLKEWNYHTQLCDWLFILLN